MGIFDKLNTRLRGIGKFGETVRKSFEQTPARLTLDEDHSTWAGKAVTHLKLDWEFGQFSERIEKLVTEAGEALNALTAEATIQRLPERARTVNQLHAHEYAQAARKVLVTIKFTELFRFEEDHQAFLDAMQSFRDRSAKHAAAVREHLGKELDAAEGLIQEIEDETIRFAQLLEGKHYEHVKRMHEAHEALVTLDGRRAKEEELLTSLRTDRERTAARIEQIEAEIRKQEDLIRNDEARQALREIVALEEELDKRAGPVQQAARDALTYYRKFPDTVPPGGARQALEDLDHDPARAIAGDADRIATALLSVAEHVTEEGRPNTRPLATKLERVGQRIDEIAPKIAGLLPKQSQLRKGVMRDVAALAAYDKRQFLLAARRELEVLDAKIAYVEEDLDPGKRIAHERALKDAAHAIGASIPGDVPPTADANKEPQQPATPTVPEVDATAVATEAAAKEEELAAHEADAEVAKAETSLAEAKKLLGEEPAKKKGKR